MAGMPECAGLRAMSCRFVVWFCIISAAIAAGHAEDAITRDWLVPNYFADLRASQSDEVIFTMRDSGSRFYVQHSGVEDKVSDYNEKISMHTGETISFASHHGSLRWTPLPRPLDHTGWLVESRRDERSVGRGEIVRYGIALLLKGNELRFVEPENNFNPALPPDDPTWQKISKLVSDNKTTP